MQLVNDLHRVIICYITTSKQLFTCLWRSAQTLERTSNASSHVNSLVVNLKIRDEKNGSYRENKDGKNRHAMFEEKLFSVGAYTQLLSSNCRLRVRVKLPINERRKVCLHYVYWHNRAFVRVYNRAHSCIAQPIACILSVTAECPFPVN